MSNSLCNHGCAWMAHTLTLAANGWAMFDSLSNCRPMWRELRAAGESTI